jgi:hypothetical protein
LCFLRVRVAEIVLLYFYERQILPYFCIVAAAQAQEREVGGMKAT